MVECNSLGIPPSQTILGHNMTQTIQQKLEAALLARGEQRVPAKTGKYLVYTAKSFGFRNMRDPITDKFFFLGYAGALRFGSCATKSVPVDKIKGQLLEQVALAAKVMQSHDMNELV